MNSKVGMKTGLKENQMNNETNQTSKNDREQLVDCTEITMCCHPEYQHDMSKKEKEEFEKNLAKAGKKFDEEAKKQRDEIFKGEAQ